MNQSEKITLVCRDDTRVRRVDCRHCAVRHMMMFSVLESTEFDHLLQPIHNTRLQKGDVIFRQGDEAVRVVSLRRGLVKLVQDLPDGTERIVRLLGPGAALGLEAMIDQRYQQRAVALTEVDVCLIPAASLQDLDRRNPALHAKVMGHWQSHLEQADRVITQLNTGTVKDRIAQLLLLLVELAGHDQSAPVLLSTEDMASLVATTKESASRVMADFRRRGLVERFPKGRFRLDDLALRKVMTEGAR